jgi:hypothetical protein
VLKWIRLSKEIGFKLTLRNYSKCEDSLVEDFFTHALNIQGDFNNLKYPNQEIVNRSLSFVEYELQRVFNAAFGKQSSRYVSDFLVNKFPHVTPWKATLTERVYEQICHENLDFINTINSHLDDNIHLEIGDKEQWVNTSKEHIHPLDNEICEILGAQIKKSITPLATNDVDILRDVSIKIANDFKDIDSALKIMRVAEKHKPNEPTIKSKIEEWTVSD